jgi:excisionase family DNA binding protein
MTERKSHSRSHTKLTIEERAEVEALETLTLTRKLLRSAKGALTAKQLAEVLNISPKTVFKLAKAGRIPSFRVGTVFVPPPPASASPRSRDGVAG